MSRSARRVLIVEGGGMRGAYAAGALIGLHDASRFNFDAVWATSSGAASAAYGVAGQPEGLDIWKDHLHGNRLVSRLRFVTGRSALDLDYLVDEVFRKRVPLDVKRLHERGVPLRVPATDVETGDVTYFDASRRDPFPILRAAMSLPGAALEAVPLDGRRYVDGGVVDQIPIEKALEAGARDLTVVLTRPPGYTAPPIGAVGLWLATRRFPGIRGALERRHERYQHAMELLAQATRDLSVDLIQPTRSLPVQRWTTQRDRILAAIDQGLVDAQHVLAGGTRSRGAGSV